ncbi:ribokinase [Sporosarcina sp. HYO08]|uniref:ribokinase n=1 Tax=Sporosarcina sp. HYO08 TaxID=1759557 RepID=UPI00079ACCFB|nr:ribokinase [Sporosarcina sp. HYO08]KXH78779.1 ribokinase [Sporosarcina sp. HYO08]
MGQAPKITVVGSINMDLVTITDQLPKMGETILGQQFQMNPGGKGANQAVASARLGAAVQMVGCVGEDLFGEELLQHLQNEGIDVSNVERVPDQTGTASIVVSNKDNNIIVVPGANNYVTASFVEAKRETIANSDILILQLEIPLEGVQKAVEIAKENDVTVILNPAPICELSADLLEKVDYLTPNEHEFQHLNIEGNRAALIGKVILTKGSEGVSYFQEGKEINIPAYQIDVVDTTGAGDSFNAGFAVALGKGLTVEAACQYGNAVAALSTTKLGAQTGMPTKGEVSAFINHTNVK